MANFEVLNLMKWLGFTVHRQVRPVDLFVGDRLRAFRINAGETIEGIATYLAINPTIVRRFETGRQRVSAARLYMLAKRFDVPVAAFFPIGGG